jgi:hypothetical protein
MSAHAELAPQPAVAVAKVGATARLHRLPVYIACTVLAVLTNYLLGKDVAWDTQNYHLYAGFSALNDRFAQDYFAAGAQSYFNPYVYWPFYALVSAGFSALAISSALAVAHSVILWLTFELGVQVCPSDDRRTRVTIGVCAVALAFVNPILMQQIGSCFADITTGTVVLAGWLVLANAVRTPKAALVICGGLILGAACALKLTNAVHAISGFAVLIMLPLSLRGRMIQALRYGVSLGLGFAVVTAPWSFRLERMFGNPLFPLLNNVFRSPHFTTGPLRHFRFVPGSFAEALWRPFAMVEPTTMLHYELLAPDLRYAVLLALLAVLCLHWLRRRFAHASTSSAPAKHPESGRVLAALGCGFATDWVLWLYGSGNSRYFLPMACVAAVVVVGLLFRLCAARPKMCAYILGATLSLQALQLGMGAELRWAAAPWGGPWFEIAVPEKLRTEPSLYLTIGLQSNSYIAPFLAKGSGLVNFSGGYSLGPEGASGARIEELIHRYAPHLRVLLESSQPYKSLEGWEQLGARADIALERFGLRAEASDCATITVRGPPPAERGGPPDMIYLVSCHVVPDNADHTALRARKRAVDIVFDRLEHACPELFQPRGLRSDQFGPAWARHYVNTDLTAWIYQGWVKFGNPSDAATLIGRESDWASAPLRLECGRHDGHYVARVLK